MKKSDAYLDLHAHILPGTDHGAKDIEESLELISSAKSAGIGTIVATPHFYGEGESVADFVKNREVGYVALMSELRKRRDDIRIIKAAEVHLTGETADLPDIERLCIEGTDKILIELPDTYWGAWLYDALYAIKARRGLTPIIAHIDRYPIAFTDKLYSMGFPIQINADSASSYFTCRKYREHIKSGEICFLGSDAHDIEHRNYSHFLKAHTRLTHICPNFDKNAENILEI